MFLLEGAERTSSEVANSRTRRGASGVKKRRENDSIEEWVLIKSNPFYVNAPTRRLLQTSWQDPQNSSKTLSGPYHHQQQQQQQPWHCARASTDTRVYLLSRIPVAKTARFVKITRNRVFFSSEENRGCRVQLFYRRGFMCTLRARERETPTENTDAFA